MQFLATIISDESLAPTAEPYAEVTVAGRDYLNVNFTWNAISADALPTVYVLTFSVTSTLSNATNKVADMVSCRLMFIPSILLHCLGLIVLLC